MDSPGTNKKRDVASWVLIAAILVILAGFMWPLLSRHRMTSRPHPCADNLFCLAIGQKTWAINHEGKFADKLSDLYPDYVNGLDCFTCPSSGDPRITKKEDIDSLTSYVLRKGLTESSPLEEVLIYEKPSNHGEAGGAVVFVDGLRRWVTASELMEIADKDRSKKEESETGEGG